MSEWRLAWRIARRELHARFRGLRLLLVCLFLGVGALAAIGSLTQAISGELASRGRIILGGDVEFAVSQRGPNAEERAAMARLGPLSETIRMQSMAIRDTPQGARTVPVELKAVDAPYPLYGALTLSGGRTANAPPPDQVYVAPALVDRLGVRAGDLLRFGSARFTVGGVIADEPDRLGEGFTLGPVAILSREGMARTGLVQPGSLYETKIRVRMTGGDPTAAADALKAQFPLAGWETRTRDNAAPGASRFIGRMGQFLTLVGLAALIIAGIGVGNGVSAYLAARRGSIATLKVLGATSGLIARVYLLQIVTVAAAGIAAGLAVGIAAVPIIILLAGDVLPVAPQFAVHPLPLLLAAAYGLLIALAFAAPPLIAAGEVPAAGLLRGLFDQRRAPLRKIVPWMAAAGIGLVALVVLTSREPLFSAGFLAAAAGVLLLLAGFGWIVRRAAQAAPRPRRPLLRLAIAALHRPGARTGTLVVALGLGLTLFVLLAAIRTSLDANIQRSVPQRAPALFALDVPRDREARFPGDHRRRGAAIGHPHGSRDARHDHWLCQHPRRRSGRTARWRLGAARRTRPDLCGHTARRQHGRRRAMVAARLSRAAAGLDRSGTGADPRASGSAIRSPIPCWASSAARPSPRSGGSTGTRWASTSSWCSAPMRWPTCRTTLPPRSICPRGASPR